jgi:CHAT domain-containing protein
MAGRSRSSREPEDSWSHIRELYAAQSSAARQVALEQWDNAYTTLHRALAHAQEMSPRVATQEERREELAAMVPVHQLMAEVCLNVRPPRIRDSFLAADAAASRYLSRQLFNFPVAVPENGNSSMMELLHREANDLKWLRTSIDFDLGDADQALAQLESIWDALDAAGAREYVAMRRGAPLDWADVQRWLARQRLPGATYSQEISPVAPWLTRGRRVAVLEFFTTHRETMVFVVRHGDAEPVLVRLGDSAHLQRGYAPATPRSGRREGSARLAPARDLAAHDQTGGPMYLQAAWLRPVLPYLDGVELLYVVPHGWLHNVPLHALECDGTSLIELFPVVYAPSVSVARRVTNTPVNAMVIDRTLVHGSLIAGNPTGDLTYAEDEARAVAELVGFPAGLRSRRFLLRERATKGDVLFELPSVTHVHLAAHAYFAAGDPYRPTDFDSGVVMAGGKVLRAADLQREEVDIRLLVVSACSSGVQLAVPGNELMGLARGFLCAGVASQLLTLWSVNDRSTAEFMRIFYKHLLNERAVMGYSNSGRSQRTSVAEALRSAVLDLRKTKEWADPYHWAPFILVGDWR